MPIQIEALIFMQNIIEWNIPAQPTLGLSQIVTETPVAPITTVDRISPCRQEIRKNSLFFL